MGIIRIWPALLAIAAVTGCKSSSGVSPAPTAPAPAQLASTTAGTPQTSGKGLPNPALTPGERTAQPNPRTEISEETQQKVLQAYGAAPGDPQSVVCRLIPPEIGGTNNPPNLFVTTPWFANLKARLDKKLVELVNSKQITAEQAESDLKANWIKANHKYYVRNYGEGTQAGAKKKEDAIQWER